MSEQLQLRFMFWVLRALRSLLRREDGALWRKLDELSEEIETAFRFEPKKGYVEFNINDNVFVKLNPEGLKILDKHYKHHRFMGTLTNGYYQFQVHQLMSIFGNYMVSFSAPFVPIIRIAKKDLVEK